MKSECLEICLLPATVVVVIAWDLDSGYPVGNSNKLAENDHQRH